MTLTRWIVLFLAFTALSLVAAFWREVPRWRWGGAQPVSTASVAWGGDRLPCPGMPARIAIYGDSHVEGIRGAGGGKPFGKVLEERLGQGARVDLNGVGGDTAAMGEGRWLRGTGSADIVIIAYGTNDAAPRGWLRGKEPVGVEAFKASLTRHIDHWKGKAQTLVLLAPPPPGSAAMLDRMQPYRRAVAELGKARRIPVIDPADAFARCGTGGPPLLNTDALHMTAAGHQCLGQFLAEQLCPVP